VAPPRGPRSARTLAFAARWAPVAGRIATGLGVVLAICYWWLLTTTDLGQPVDVRAYWAADPAHLYPSGDDWRATGYLYSPAFELVVGWGRLLPFEVFTAIWRALQLVSVVYLAGPLSVPVLLLYPVASEVNAGNVQLFLALAIVLGFRWPATWAFVLLTKVTPGLGLAWFALRRRWRDLGIALGVTAAIAIATAVLWPDRWAGFVQLMTGHSAPAVSPWYLSFWDRLPWAIGFVVLGAWRGWRWPVVVGSTLALPVFYAISPSLLVGVLPFLREAVGRRLGYRASEPPAPSDPGQLPLQPVPEPGAILDR
jgi:hypothetical protein